jgi:hypothetical protein
MMIGIRVRARRPVWAKVMADDIKPLLTLTEVFILWSYSMRYAPCALHAFN